jgi:hypothetical protein
MAAAALAAAAVLFAVRPALALRLNNVQQDVQVVLMESSRVGFLGDAAEP